jgi:hypothetical protein
MPERAYKKFFFCKKIKDVPDPSPSIGENSHAGLLGLFKQRFKIINIA